MRFLIITIVWIVSSSACADEQAFVRARMVEAVRIGQDDQSGLPSSIAATGIGLVSLTAADALGIDPDAEAKAVQFMPFTRSPADELLGALDFAIEKNYPARGEYVGAV